MNYFQANRAIYMMISDTLKNIPRLTPVQETAKKYVPRQRLEESKFVLTEETREINRSIVTAHLLYEYRPTRLKVGQFMNAIDLPLDHLLALREIE